MERAFREKVIKWFQRKYDNHKVYIGYDPVKEAAEKYGITYKQALECKIASFRRYFGMGKKLSK